MVQQQKPKAYIAYITHCFKYYNTIYLQFTANFFFKLFFHLHSSTVICLLLLSNPERLLETLFRDFLLFFASSAVSVEFKLQKTTKLQSLNN